MTTLAQLPPLSDVTLADRCAHWATVTPNAPCLTSGDTTRSWAEVMERCRRLAAGLTPFGRGARIIYLGRNSTVFIELAVASSMAGTVLTAVNWRLAAPEMAQVVEHSTSALAFVQDEFAQLWADASSSSSIPAVHFGGDGSNGDEQWDYEHWLAEHEPTAPNGQQAAAADDIALQMYTSGTTGLPKGALFTHAALQGVSLSADAMGITDKSTMLVAIPIFHAGGAGAATIALRAGAHLVMSADTSPDALAAAVERYSITSMMLVPTLLNDILSRPSAMARDLSSLEIISYCGSPITPTLLARCIDGFKCGLVQLYGLTEVNGISVLRVEDHLDAEHPERLRSVGRALPGVVVKIIDPLTGTELPAGETGEICVKAPTVMSGYFRAPDRTAEAFTSDGFLRSGDGGYMLDGYLYLRDRIKDMIISGGENVYPVEVEKVLVACPGVADVAVIGVPSERWGETVKAVVVPTAEDPSTVEAVADFARLHLAGYKCPTSVELVSALPRNASGKLLKRVVRDRDWIDAHRV
ncbi:AMP-binding protein [Gordonia polyisoprenivorans]|uniref:AMP-binding protein n=1 Tax=Gordonia polyisoprenivorans TaxID=84595 RepID=UPI001AD7BEFA|nr:AMP-binding protein [Gordonia polyisoprenivorans]QTI69909.1 AMP-binding protein [Gordonia polyisoprenivorans]